jgi:molecular chaperone GrpE
MSREPGEGLIEEVEPEDGDIETIKKTIVEEKARAEANLAGWQRAQADFTNFKRRTEQEKEEIGKFANSLLVVSLLPVLDDLERALDSVSDDIAELSWVDGIKLIERKLQGILEAQGLSPIETVGELFDPYLHEAVRQDDGKEGVIVEELHKGYKFNERVIRPSMVVVGKGEVAEAGENNISS